MSALSTDVHRNLLFGSTFRRTKSENVPKLWDIATANITNIPVWISGDLHTPVLPISGIPSHKGVLNYGERYVVYLMDLYADGFKKHK